jgi:hypothetical protein
MVEMKSSDSAARRHAFSHELPGPGWPAGTVLSRVVFTAEPAGERRIIADLPVPISQRAIALPPDSHDPAALEILAIPCEEPEAGGLTDAARNWIGAGSQTVTFQGAILIWGNGRTAALAAAGRLPALEAVLAEVAFFEADLSGIEQQLAEIWPELEKDAGPAFEFDERFTRLRPKLEARFAQVMSLRARVTRLLPAVFTPHVYPPTLASQVNERLRERLRLRHRLEMIQDQLEVFERVYDTCAQRASDYRANRRGHTLEMIIIVILVAHLMLGLFEILTRAKV